MQEFEDRRTYDVNKTHKELILVTTSTCPNCKQAEKILNEANIAFTKVLAEDNMELVKRLGIMQAPTLVKGDKKYSGLSEIYKFIS